MGNAAASWPAAPIEILSKPEGSLGLLRKLTCLSAGVRKPLPRVAERKEDETNMKQLKKKSVALAVGSALVGGLGVGIVGITTMATADSRPAAEVSTDSTLPTGDASATDTPPADAPPPDAPQGRRDHLASALDPLVKDGTITQTQADKVIDAIVAAEPMRGGRKGGRLPLEVVAKAIGISVDTLRSELDGTKSIADVAKAHNADVQKVIDALVADATSHIDAAVKDGKLTADQAATAKSTLADRITKRVNNVAPVGRGGRDGHDGGRHGGPDGDGDGPGGPDGPPPADGGAGTSGSSSGSGSGIRFA